MKKLRKILIIVGVLLLLAGLGFFLVGYFKPKSGGILVETIPSSSVFINSEQVGRTPFETTLEPGEIVLKLIPESLDTPLAPFEVKVGIESGIKTVVRRTFAESEHKSSGEIISFEKVGGKESSLSIVSIPDAAQVTINGSVRGFAPYKTENLLPGEHQLNISAPDYLEQNVAVKVVEGYKLIAVIKLAPSNEEKKKEEEEVVEEEVVMIKILSTSTGFLRVRSGPSTLDPEVAQVKPEEEFVFLEENEETGWFKIEYEEGEEGWVSGEYAELVEDEELND